ncbi:immunoglobulin domain-containing protein [Mucilaginibacter myungsuensis]|nr:hypothetical protein [Mucilaginibacter myungsuensis]
MAISYSNRAVGQCTIPVNTYANTQQFRAISLGGDATVTNPVNATGADLTNYSQLYGGTLGTVTQYLKFADPVTVGTPVTVKLSVPTSVLSVLGNVTIQPFVNLHQSGGNWTADAVGVATTDASLLGLLNGGGDSWITITPKTAGNVNVAYDGVWVRMSGITIAQSINVYGAFTTATGLATDPAVACGPPIDVLSGVRAGTVLGGIANATGTVTNPFSAIDTDPTYITYSELFVGAQVLSQVYHTTIFNALSQTGDKVRMVLQRPGGGLLDLNAITNFTIQLYNGGTPVGSAVTSSSGLLSLSLLPGSTAGNEKYVLELAAPVSFDRVDVQVGGLAGVGLVPGLRIYDVKRIIANPLTNVNGDPGTSATVCEGSTSTFAVNNTQTCTTYKWYDALTGGNLLHTGTSYTPAASGLSTTAANNYYVEAVRDGCTETTVRTPVVINVNPAPAITPGTGPRICIGNTATSWSYTGATNTPNTYSIVWSAAANTAGFTNVTDAVLPPGAISITVPPAAPVGPYSGTLYVKNANGCLSTGKPFTLTVDARSTQPVINLTP